MSHCIRDTLSVVLTLLMWVVPTHPPTVQLSTDWTAVVSKNIKLVSCHVKPDVCTGPMALILILCADRASCSAHENLKQKQVENPTS